MQSTTPPRNPLTYEALCAHQSAMNRGRAGGERRYATDSGAETIPCCVSTKPAMPNEPAHAAMTKRSVPIEWIKALAGSFGRAPARAAIAKNRPRTAPTHQVAIIPHPMAKRVGDWETKTGGWKTVKYSIQIRAVNWS